MGSSFPSVWKEVMGMIGKSKETPVVSTVHHPLGNESLWHTPDKHVPDKQQLPAYLHPEHGEGPDAGSSHG